MLGTFKTQLTPLHQNRFFSTAPQKKRQFQSQLKSINPLPEKILEQSYLLSNEKGWGSVLDSLSQRSKRFNSHHLVLLTGESNCLSVLPTLREYSKTILVNDVDVAVHKNLQLMRQIILSEDNTEDFINTYYRFMVQCQLYEPEPNSYHFRKMLKSCIEALGEYHFLSSDTRYKVCRAAARQTTFFHAYIDYFNGSHVKALAHVLNQHQYQVAICNISNVRDYDENNALSKNLTYLVNRETLILHSTLKDNTVQALPPLAYGKYQAEYANVPGQILPKYT